MFDWRILAAVAVGGALGSVVRFVLQTLVVARIGTGFPWATFGINVVGSFAIGFVAAIAARDGTPIGPTLRLFLTVGVLGGFTTFSSFSLETLTLARGGALAPAFAYAAGSVVLGCGAALLGTVAGRGGAA